MLLCCRRLVYQPARFRIPFSWCKVEIQIALVQLLGNKTHNQNSNLSIARLCPDKQPKESMHTPAMQEHARIRTNIACQTSQSGKEKKEEWAKPERARGKAQSAALHWWGRQCLWRGTRIQIHTNKDKYHPIFCVPVYLCLSALCLYPDVRECDDVRSVTFSHHHAYGSVDDAREQS